VNYEDSTPAKRWVFEYTGKQIGMKENTFAVNLVLKKSPPNPPL